MGRSFRGLNVLLAFCVALLFVPLLSWLLSTGLCRASKETRRHEGSRIEHALEGRLRESAIAFGRALVHAVETVRAEHPQVRDANPIVRRAQEAADESLRARTAAKSEAMSKVFLACIAAEFQKLKAEASSGVADSEPRRIPEVLFLFVAGLFALAFSIDWIWRRKVGRPLAELASAMDASSMDAEPRVAKSGLPEVEVVRDAFNRMADTLLLVRRNLESRVDAKTVALASALEEQKSLNERLLQVLDELRATQARLVQTEKLAAIGTLSGGVAHEFNNVLGGIRGCARELLGEGLGRDAEESLNVIIRAADRGAGIVRGLLQVSRGASDQRSLFDLQPIVTDVARFLLPLATGRGVAIEIAGSSNAQILAGPIEIGQVLTNLLQNAIQFSPRGSKVVVRIVDGEGRTQVRFEDEGPGISESAARRIFEPFFTTREAEGGTGLGLAVSHAIVLSLGGRLWFEARPAGGTIFVLELDVHSPTKAESEPPRPRESAI